MFEHLPTLILLLSAIAAVSLIAPRLKLPPPVLWALAGFGIAFVPGVRSLEIPPELILVLFLPPLLYADAFDTSWVDFQRWLRPILMLAVGLVALTIAAVCVAAQALFPGLPFAACFTLGKLFTEQGLFAPAA